jgi:hypothetical protein
MQPNREFFAWRLMVSFLLATLVFILFFAFAYLISYINYQQLTSQNNLIEKTVSEFDGVLANFTCDDAKLLEASGKLDTVADKLTLLEKRFGKQDKRVLEQKKIYSELEYRHFKITERFNKECNGTYVRVLFFYSNIGSIKESESDRVGFILTAFERENADRVMIYSFDFDLNSSVIKNITEYYHVTSVPRVVIGNDQFYPKRIDQLEQYV